MTKIQVELAVVGAGPAGISAAMEAAERGVKTLVLDEGAQPGGRMLSQVHENPKRKGEWINGPAIVGDLIQEARKAGVDFLLQAEVWGLWPRWVLTVGGPAAATAEIVEAKTVLVATGAAQNPLPFPGWTLPGVMMVGAAQVMLHQCRMLPGRRVLVVGSDPLALSIAQEVTMLGGEVVGVVLPPPGPAVGSAASPREAISNVTRLAELAPNPFLRLAGNMFKGGAALGAGLYPREGLRVQGIPMMFRRCIVQAMGEPAVNQAVIADLTADGRIIPRTEKVIDVDAICTSGGLYPLAELAEVSGECKFGYVEELGGWIPLYSPEMQTTAAGLFVAGSASGVESAHVAIAQGTLAGLGVVAHLGRISGPEAAKLLANAAKGVEVARKEALISFHPNIDKGRARVSQLWQDSSARAAS